MSEQQQPQMQRKLMRVDEGSVIAGVCSGLGAYTGIDPVVWRIGFVVLAFIGVGTGLIAYLVAWLIMPKAEAGSTTVTPYGPRAGRASLSAKQAPLWVGVTLVILGAWVLMGGLFNPRLPSGVLFGILLIVAGAVLWGRELSGRSSTDDSPPPPPPPPTPPRPVGGVDQESASQAEESEGGESPLDGAEDESSEEDSQADGSPPPPTSGGGATTTGAASFAGQRESATPTTPLPPTPPHSPPPAPATSAPRPPRPRREPSILGRLVVGAAALAIGAGVLLDNLGILRLTATGVLAVLLAIVAAGLLVGTLWGRARWLIVPGAILSAALILTSLVPFHLEGGWGEVAWQPTRASDVENTYHHAAGQAVLDLGRVSFPDRRQDIDVRVGFGQLFVVVPDDVDVVVSAQVQGGEATLFGRRISGWDVGTRVIDRSRGAGPLYIDARVTFGEIIVQRQTDGPLPLRGNRRIGGRMEERFRQMEGLMQS